MKIATSYFYQIRNFTSNMVPVSTALSDPAWYRPPEGKEYYIDKRGIVCGLRYKPLIVQPTWGCPCQFQGEDNPCCDFLREYRRNLYEIDKEKTLKAFEYCLNKFNADTIVLIVYETPKNPCSERYALQEFFECEELKYPIDKNYKL